MQVTKVDIIYISDVFGFRQEKPQSLAGYFYVSITYDHVFTSNIKNVYVR